MPGVVFQPQLAQNQYLQVQYQTRIAAPSVTQLRPVAGVTNPLFIQAGNPALRPEYTHSLSISYNRFQTTTYRTVFALLSVGLTNHRIVSATTIDATGVQTTRPANANGYTTANGTVSVGQRLQIGFVKSYTASNHEPKYDPGHQFHQCANESFTGTEGRAGP